MQSVQAREIAPHLRDDYRDIGLHLVDQAAHPLHHLYDCMKPLSVSSGLVGMTFGSRAVASYAVLGVIMLHIMQNLSNSSFRAYYRHMTERVYEADDEEWRSALEALSERYCDAAA